MEPQRVSLLEMRQYRAEEIARLFGVDAHLVTYDLSPGYWERKLAERVRRRSLRFRLKVRLVDLLWRLSR